MKDRGLKFDVASAVRNALTSQIGRSKFVDDNNQLTGGAVVGRFSDNTTMIDVGGRRFKVTVTEVRK